MRITMAILACCFLLGSSYWAQDKSSPEQNPTQIKEQLKTYVKKLAIDFGERNLTHLDSLNQSADWIEKTLKSFGYKVSRQTFTVNNIDCHNIIAEKTGTKHPEEIVIVGAHYDSAANTPGANDNGSGTASMLALADLFKKDEPDRTVRFLAFTNEEPPYFQTENQMGSWVYARQCRKNQENIVGAISLETMGYFSDEENSQKYPALISALYPSTGNFIGFVGNTQSNEFTRRCFRVFKTNSTVPAEVASLSGSLPGVGWSDHWSFWQEGYAGVMITDTAPFRYPHYHKPTDTPDKINFATLAKVVKGLQAVVNTLTHVDSDK